MLFIVINVKAILGEIIFETDLVKVLLGYENRGQILYRLAM
jgi:hypothetical protein